MEIKNEREDLLFLIQDLLKAGAMPSDVLKQNYYDLMEVLKARPRDERPELVDPLAAVLGRR